MRPNTSPVALRQARQHLLDSGQCPSGLVDERLLRSWHRSRGAGLEPALRRVEPGAGGSVRVSFEYASFDELVAWEPYIDMLANLPDNF